MSNHLAIATVTAVLRNTLQAALEAAQPQVVGARVTTTRPNAPAADLPAPGVNIFLYQTSPSEALRNQDLPRRGGDGSVIQRPQAALDLHYLLTFHGADARLEPQIMHGITTRALYEQPLLTREVIEATVADPTYDFVLGSDLADAVERVRVTSVALSVEEMAKLWQVFYQIPYVLSAAYRASVVVIESELAAHSALPVRATRLRLQASRGPRIDRVVSAADPTGQVPIVAGQDVVLLGQNLQAPVTRVRFGDLEVIPGPAAVRSDRVQVTPPAALLAGLHGVELVHRQTVEPSSTDVVSNAAPFVVSPAITAQTAAAGLAVHFTPPVGRTQRVAVLLDEIAPPAGREARSYLLRAGPRGPTDPDTAATLTLALPASGVAAGSYVVRAQVDGAESQVTYDPVAGVYNAPAVTFP